MKLSELNGPLSLNSQNLDQAVQKSRIGVYVLGHQIAGGFFVERIGRADRDLKQEIRAYVGKFAYFKAAYCSTAEEAYNIECQLWHDFGNPLHNPRHPAPPDGTGWRCPRGKQCLLQNAVMRGA